MRKQLLRVGIAVLGILAFVAVTDVVAAKGFSSSRSSSSFSSRPSSSGLYNKPSSGGYSKPTAPANSGATSGGYGKPATPPANNATGSAGYSKPQTSASPAPSSAATAYTNGNRFDSSTTQKLKMEKSQKSLASYEAEKGKFKTPPPAIDPHAIQSNPVVSSSHVYSRVGYDDVIRRRQAVYGSWHPPIYVYQSAPYYGSWSSTFLWWALMNDAMFFHHHSNDPAVSAWHNDAMRLSQENGDLKAQIATLDEKVQQLDKSGPPRNEKYLPAQVAADPVVALSAEAIAQMPIEKPLLRVATGVQGGQYSEVGQMLKKRSDGVKIELVPTSGSEENLKLLREGKVDAAIVQSDTSCIMGKNSPATLPGEAMFHHATLYSEYVMLIVSKDSSIKSIENLGSDNTIYVGPEGSGTALTWLGFEMQDQHYKKVKSANTDYALALEKVAGDKTKAMLFVAGMNTPLLNNLSSKGGYRVVPVDDRGLSALQDAQGHIVYDVLTLPKGTYPGLQAKEIKTLGVDAEWTISNAWIDKYGDESFDQINYSVIDIVNDLHRKSPAQEQAELPAHSSHLWFWVGVIFVVGAGLYWTIFKFNATGTR
ncbi:MAG: TAXI family TRAP transporter solute-binding subunit [Verrucomicrobia bacterium]|nr:MAG: TAXI family TRAP transporter solute-binding subunit [Verrucomicrobiota bacterium]